MKTNQVFQKQLSKIFLAVAAAGLSGYANADLSDTSSLVGAIGLGDLVAAGTGCPKGSVHADWDRDSNSVVLRFEEMQAIAGGEKTLDRKACALALPIKVPAGYSVSAGGIKLRGFSYLPDNARGSVNLENFFAGSKGPVLKKTLVGPLSDEFTLDSSRVGRVWSACGEDVILRSNMSVMISNPDRNAQGIVGVVQAEANRSSALVLGLRIKACR